jgi:nucleotide-binding universal stress UspA family protein
MSSLERLVVGVDLGPGGRQAIALARALAPQAHLVLARAFTYGTSAFVAGFIRWDEACTDTELKLLADEREAAGVEAELEVVAETSPARALQEIATGRNADLIVVGSAHRGPVGRVLLGDVGRGLLGEAPCPVAVAPRDYEPRAWTTIGVGLDGSPESARAVDLAGDLARELGARIALVSVVSTAPPTTPSVFDWAGWAAEERTRATSLIEKTMSRLDVPVRGEVLEGAPSRELAQKSETLDLLVVGSRRWGPARRVLLGSTADHLAHHAGCPLIVAPRPSAS